VNPARFKQLGACCDRQGLQALAEAFSISSKVM
jgi:hypothetical protein